LLSGEFARTASYTSRIGGKNILYVNHLASEGRSSEICQQLGGELVTTELPDERAFVRKQARFFDTGSASGQTWVGIGMRFSVREADLMDIVLNDTVEVSGTVRNPNTFYYWQTSRQQAFQARTWWEQGEPYVSIAKPFPPYAYYYGVCVTQLSYGLEEGGWYTDSCE
jgi:hypothetical protein